MIWVIQLNKDLKREAVQITINCSEYSDPWSTVELPDQQRGIWSSLSQECNSLVLPTPTPENKTVPQQRLEHCYSTLPIYYFQFQHENLSSDVRCTELISLQTRKHNLAPFSYYYTQSQHIKRLKCHSVIFNHLCQIQSGERDCCSAMIYQLIIHLHRCDYMCFYAYIYPYIYAN